MEIFQSQRSLAVMAGMKKLNVHTEPTQSNANNCFSLLVKFTVKLVHGPLTSHRDMALTCKEKNTL